MARKPEERKVLASNRRARHEYELLETLEAGLELTGTEVKAARTGKVQLQEAHVEIRNGEAWLIGAHVSAYSHGNRENHPPERERRLLLSRRELDRLYGRSQAKGVTIVPLALIVKGNWLKLEIALAQGKRLYDKRETERVRVLEREAEEAIKHRSYT